jgi:hypothetical protein
MLYGADIWGFTDTKDKSLYRYMQSDILEKCHLKFLRYTLGVNKRALNVAVYGDSGRYPLILSAVLDYVKYWHRVANTDNKLLSNAYQHSVINNNTWYQNIKKLLHKINLTIESAAKQKLKMILNKILAYMQEEFKSGWKTELNNDTRKGSFGNKLRCYRTFKSTFKAEPYLFQCRNNSARKHMSRLRLSCHKLHIETGRYARGNDRLKPEERICKICSSGECEDEFHFLMKCEFYTARQHFLNKIAVICPAFSDLSDHNKFIFIMSTTEREIINIVCKYTAECFSLRKEGTPTV